MAEKIQFFYHQQAALIKKALNSSNLKNMVIDFNDWKYSKIFRPSLFLPNGNLQTFFNPIMGTYMKFNNPVIFDRELFKLHDDGTIALDWVDSIPTKEN